MRGKNKCKILKQIRQKIADENDIPYVTQECTFQGECKGTCPKCEAELRYLEQQLQKRQRLGKAVTVAALSASLMANLTACPSEPAPIERTSPEGTFFAQTTESEVNEFEGAPTEATENSKLGEVEFEGEPTETCEIIGEVEATEEIVEIEGDVAYFDPSEDIYDVALGMLPIEETEPDE